MPWKIRATMSEAKLGEAAHQTEQAMSMTAPKRYTGRFPYRMAVGEKMTDPIPMPIMYKPVVRETCSTSTWYSAATLVKPAARIGVNPPPIMQKRPRESRAASRRQAGQFNGSLGVSSGWGSRMILPSAVVFFASSGGGGIGAAAGDSPVGIEECDVLAGALRRPRGSLRSLAKSKTDPML